MTTKPLYIIDGIGTTTFTLDKPPNYDRTITRLIAGDGMELTDGVTATSCIDTSTPELWTEREKPEPETE